MPVLDGGLVMRLRGTKIDVTDEYDGPRLQEDEAQH
jgi:hypothetical protein